MRWGGSSSRPPRRRWGGRRSPTPSPPCFLTYRILLASGISRRLAVSHGSTNTCTVCRGLASGVLSRLVEAGACVSDSSGFALPWQRPPRQHQSGGKTHANVNPRESKPRRRQSQETPPQQRRSRGTSSGVGLMVSPATRLSAPSWCCTDRCYPNRGCEPTGIGLTKRHGP